MIHLFGLLSIQSEINTPLLCFRFRRKFWVCVKQKKDNSICTGDTGGALVCDKKAVGVAHMMVYKKNGKCKFEHPPVIDCGIEHAMAVYMYICPYLIWIREKLPNVPPAPLSCKAAPLRRSNATPIVTLLCATLIVVLK